VILPPIEVVAGPRFPHARLFERPEELDESFDQLSPRAEWSPSPPGSRLSSPLRPASTRPELRSILRVRQGETSQGESAESPASSPGSTDPAVRPVSPTRLDANSAGGDSPGSPVTPSDTYSPLPSLPPSPPPTPVPAGFRRDGLLVSGIPPAPAAESLPDRLSSISTGRRPAPSDDSALTQLPPAVAAAKVPGSITELWTMLQARDLAHASEEVEKTRMMAYAMLRPPLPSDAERRRDLLMARSPSELLEVLQASSPDPPCSGKQIADALVENTELRRDNDALTRRMHSALADSARLNHSSSRAGRMEEVLRQAVALGIVVPKGSGPPGVSDEGDDSANQSPSRRIASGD
jgi:hypothetical protein